MMLNYKLVACLIFVACGTKSENSTSNSYEDDYEDYKEEIYDDEESRDNETTHTPILCATNFSYTYARNVLNVTFAPEFIGQDYKIELIPEIGRVSTKTLHFVKPVVHVTFGRNDIVEYRNYSIVVSALDVTESLPFELSPLCLKAYKTPFLDCNLWQIGIGFQEDIREHSITAVFKLRPEFAPCFQTFTVELGTFPENDGDRKFCWKDPIEYQRQNVTYNDTMRVTFEGLSAKHYCVNVTPRHEDCPRNAECSSRYSEDGKELKEFKGNKLPSLKKEDDVSNLVALVVPSCLVVFIIIIGLIGARKKLVREYNPAYQVSTIRSSNANVFYVDSSKCKKEVIVPILYAQDIDKQQEVAVALHNFLRECCHVTSIIGENNPEVFTDISAWIQNHFDYALSRNGNTKFKILILETDAAVRLYKHKLKKIILQYRKYSHLNDVFLRGLTQLTSSSEILETNHSRIVVVRFSYFSNSNEINHFKQKRLYLPHHLVQLYNSLRDEKDLLNEKENLLNEWKEKQSYKELLRTIKEMEEFVIKHPDYLNEYVFGDTEVV